MTSSSAGQMRARLVAISDEVVRTQAGRRGEAALRLLALWRFIEGDPIPASRIEPALQEESGPSDGTSSSGVPRHLGAFQKSP